LLLRAGLLLALATVCLQIAVFLQPLLPQRYQVAPVCEKITHVLLAPPHRHELYSSFHDTPQHRFLSDSPVHDHDSSHHDPNHQCQYCTVYGNLVLPTYLDFKEILIRIQIRLITLEQVFRHIYFSLQRLFLLPQGRAPPLYIPV